MTKILLACCVAVLIAGCSSKGGTQSKAPIEQHDVLAPQKQQQEADEAAKQARIQQEQAELQRQLAEQKRKQEEAARQAEAERPEVKPLPSTSMSQKALADPASMLKEPGSVLAKRSVYYDFDAFNIKEEFQITVEAHAKFLLEHKDFKVRIEGNCDERGSREYNLALGQRRADSVKRAMTLLGVPAKQIETVSFGSEKPKALGHDEEAWAENRRSDIIYPGVDTQQ